MRMPRLRALMIGAGGMAASWLRWMPRFADRLEIVGLCDVVPQTLQEAGDRLGLPATARYGHLEEAFARAEADCAVVVIPPAHHKAAVLAAVRRGMMVLSEKPIADTWEDCVEIHRAVAAAGLKMAVVQNYRYTPRIQAVRGVLRSGALGRPHYVVARFGADYRRRDAWGSFRHQIRHALLVEGSVHHFDQIRYLSGSDCAWISGREWRPEQEAFDGECLGLYVCQMDNGVMGSYEGSCLAAAVQNSWHQELYRVECEGGAVSVDHDQRVRVLRHLGGGRLWSEEVEQPRLEYDGHLQVIHSALEWFLGGPPPETCLQDNIKSAAMLFAAVEASEGQRVVHVPAKLAAAGILPG